MRGFVPDRIGARNVGLATYVLVYDEPQSAHHVLYVDPKSGGESAGRW
jgi:hypothetical protein